jgi:uncharacterized protein (TIRG00374 family)
MAAESTIQPAQEPRRKGKLALLRWVLNIAVLVGVGLAAKKHLSGEEVIAALRDFNWVYGIPILLLSSVYLTLKAYRFVVLHRPITDVPTWTIMKAYYGGQPAALLPGGVAARAAMMNEAGVPVSHSSGPIIYSSLLDQSGFIVSALIAALWVESVRGPAAIILGVIVLLTLLLVIPATRRGFVNAIGALMRRFKAAEQWNSFLVALGEISTPKVLITGFLLTAVAYLLTIGILDMTLRGLGTTLPYATQFLAYTLPTMMGRLVPLPGGVGVTEAGITAYLAAEGGMDPNLAAAATAIFRVGSIVWQAVLGGLIYFIFWRGAKERRAADPAADAVSREAGVEAEQSTAAGTTASGRHA